MIVYLKVSKKQEVIFLLQMHMKGQGCLNICVTLEGD